MLTPKQQSLYDEYMQEVVDLQSRVMELLEDASCWEWPAHNRYEVLDRLSRGNHYKEIEACLDLHVLSQMAQQFENSINRHMMQKLSSNL